MRSTVIRLIAGGALGTAFSIALTLPGSVVFPDEPPIRQLAAPEPPTATVLHAPPLVERSSKAPARPRVVVRVYVPTAGTVPSTSAGRHAPPGSTPSRKPVEHASVEQPVTPLTAPPAAPVTEPAEEPKKTDEPREADGAEKAEQPRKSEKPRKSQKPKKAKKPKDPRSEKKNKPDDARKKGRDDQGDERGGRNKGDHGGGRGDDSSRG